MGLFGRCLPITRTDYVLILFFIGLTVAKPFESSPDTQYYANGSFSETGLWILSAAVCFCFVLSLAICTCCKKSKGFSEFRGSTQLAELSQNQPGELTLFPPPSLSLNREDLEVSFEPLPRPNQHTANPYRPKEITEWIESGYGLFPRSNIQYFREVTRGAFGQVVEAEAKELALDQTSTRCVVKILRPEASVAQQCKFLKDIQPLLKINHEHVMKLYACCLESSPLLALLQYCANGDLKQFLAAYSPSKETMGMPPLPENVLVRMACEAAEGLHQWHKAGFSHPDVAARSYMITGDMSVVIGDYGTNTITYQEDFLEVGKQQIPVRWCAPECFQLTSDLIITEGGNVWSFGVVLWEILSLGARPFATLTDEQVILQVLQEKRTILNAPTFTYQQGHALYQLMLQCWEIDPPLRPRIDVIASRLAAAHAGISRDIELDLEKEFDNRWNAAKPSRSSTSLGGESPSASLNNLHGSLDNLDEPFKEVLSPGTDKESVSGFSAKVSAALRSLDEALAAAEATDEDEQHEDPDVQPFPEVQFRIGSIRTDQVKLDIEPDHASTSSDESLFSSRSWQDKVTRGDLTALVSEKSRSVQDLMILTAVEPMSDIEFLAQQSSSHNSSKIEEHSSTPSHSQPILPSVSVAVTPPSFAVQSQLVDSDVPLLEKTEDSSKNVIDTDTYLARSRNRLTSTPREDTDFNAMESSFKEQHIPEEYAPFSPESLDDTNFTSHDEKSSLSSETNVKEMKSSPINVIIGPSEDLGLNVFQGVTSAQEEGKTMFKGSGVDAVLTVTLAEEEEAIASDPPQPSRLSVNLDAWNQFLEHKYPHQQRPTKLDPPVEEPSGASNQLKDSGIARPSFCASLDLLGSTFSPDDSSNREWMDDLSLVARMWNEELAAALALDSSLMNTHQTDTSSTDTNSNLGDAMGNVSNLSGNVTYTSPLKPGREETYFSYDKIDDDIRSEEATGAIRKDLSVIREERESVSSSDLGATPHRDIETGRELLENLQMKNRIQRHLELSDTESDLSEDAPDDDEEILVVDLENKRAVMLEGQSPKLKVAMATQNFESIFGPAPKNRKKKTSEHDESLSNGEHVNVGDQESGVTDESEDDEGDGDYEVEHPDEFQGDDEDGEEDDDGDDDEGVAVSNFIWQACYPAKFSHSYSMDVIEEECEEEEQEEICEKPFIPSTWNSEATPTKSAIKTPDKVVSDQSDKSDSENASGNSSPRKTVSFLEKKKKDIYQYEPVDIEEPATPTRRQWGTPSNIITSANDSSLSEFVDWDFAVADEIHDVDAGESKEILETEDKNFSMPIPRPPNPLTSSILYRLSGIENESESDEAASDVEHPTLSPVSHNNTRKGSWEDHHLSHDLKSNDCFAPKEDNVNELAASEEQELEKIQDSRDDLIGILRHSIDSGRLFLDFTQSRSGEEDA